ncbi:hypothetical protein SAMN06264364_101404 [Quadrisphaera granulorum]|uniref:DUF2029 domain-containing protein n=1 Tax=Quadrisphaera granulorum TaxID=317664 RepID=A0A316AF61_9ACTN|nr:hypothetical protein [Quadrisphaera granulorum]PWJ56426.1 hypothetical protein BXY45_101404 [Quadrisphaera granulorum]SZE95060.1 hypothetical protein SAMN06264364_101404 [Quadrisphaera granulorum]
MSEQARDGWFVRAAARIGDLESPFYEEEHQRDVWNEASAIGLQALTWLLPAAAAVSIWVGGAAAFPYTLVMLLAPAVVAWVVILYAWARGVSIVSARGFDPLNWRVWASGVIFVAYGAGLLRAAGDGVFSRPEVWGAIFGALVGAVAVVVAVAVSRRRERRLSAGGRNS